MAEKHSISLVKKERYADPRICFLDLSFPVVLVGHLGISGNDSPSSNRVMPMKDMEKFCKVLRRMTKTFKEIDDSHYFVSGYVRLGFMMQAAGNRSKMKATVEAALKEAGGFMTLDEWYAEHLKKKNNTRISLYAGTGSGIRGGELTLSNRIAFL